MESNLSGLSSVGEDNPVAYIQPHYKESYRLAIYALLCGGKEAYEEFLQAEQISYFLSEEEILFILKNAELPVVEDDSKGTESTEEVSPSTYFPTESDEDVPDLDLGWPEVALENTDTSISLLFHPPRQSTPSIKEVVRKQIQEARQVIAMAMDVFTDADIFKEIINAALRGVGVYILLDDSQVSSFLSMSHSLGINIHDIKNLRVRTVQGQEYQCQSGKKFHGGLEQKFILVDCRTVLYGTYSYTWSFEKINLSMVLVVTGQLVSLYDEEFRRLYALSIVPAVLSKWRPSVPYLRDTMALQNHNTSQLSLNQIHMRSRVMHVMRSTQDNRFNNAAMLTRGLSVQERLHQSHYPTDIGTLVRGHSYGGEMQKLNSMTQLRMEAKDFGMNISPERTEAKLRGGRHLLQTNRLSQQYLGHQTRYGADHNLIPFNSETSLHKWKIDTYLYENDMLLGASYDAISPVISPHSSHTGLNEHQSQLIHSKSRDIKSRMEDMRQKRLSLQEYANLRQSQESLRYGHSTVERQKCMSSMKGLDIRQSAAELVPNTQNRGNMDDGEHKKDRGTKEQSLTHDHRSVSHNKIKTLADQKTTQTFNWHEPPFSRRKSDADFDMNLTDAMLKSSHLQSNNLSIQHSRVMESLTEIPEEKELLNTNGISLDPAIGDKNEKICKEEKEAALRENSVKSSLPAEYQDQARVSHVSQHSSIGSPPPKEGRKSTAPKILSASTGHQPSNQSGHTEKETQQEAPEPWGKNSTRTKVIMADEKKASKKEEKSLQRKASFRSQHPSGSNQALGTDHSEASAAARTTKKGQSPGIPRSQNSLGGPSEAEKHKSPFSRLSPQRLSKRKTILAEEQDRVSRSTLDNEVAAISQTKRDKVYSRYEYLLSSENISHKDRSSSLNRRDGGFPMYQTQSTSDNKLGRLMQRVGNLISKNK
ncbi:uncharacterized protein PAE49_004433 [Odontesthes bonariensis]|uniref:uncharacterized protein LOC142379072 n=1 Tax=Odontesthes bonariensis TaxID=219752 RepID=UPI003F589A91